MEAERDQPIHAAEREAGHDGRNDEHGAPPAFPDKATGRANSTSRCIRRLRASARSGKVQSETRLASLVDRIFWGKPVPTPDHVRGKLFSAKMR
jgi:hypothetical protein